MAIRRSGEDVKRYSEELMKAQVQASLVRSGELVAEKYTSRVADVEGTLQLLVEAVRDRIVGYPYMERWEDGRYVPFRDYYYAARDTNVDGSGNRQEFKYPLSEPPARLDWNISKERKTVFSDPRISEFDDMLFSTAYASYHMPGICDPKANSESFICDEKYNNVTNGGKFPSTTHEGLYQSTGDLTVFMKPLYEADSELLQLQVMFFNEGAGTTLKFPAGPVVPLTRTYNSSGCEWITRLTNPYTKRPYGSARQAAKCRIGAEIESRHYNSMETGTAEFILRNGIPQEATFSTSELTSLTDQVVWSLPQVAPNNSTMILRAGKAIYDRL
jgi:hypothetical protein